MIDSTLTPSTHRAVRAHAHLHGVALKQIEVLPESIAHEVDEHVAPLADETQLQLGKVLLREILIE